MHDINNVSPGRCQCASDTEALRLSLYRLGRKNRRSRVYQAFV